MALQDIFSDHPGILRAFGNPAGAGDNTVVAAAVAPNRKIKVLAGVIVNNVATAQTVFFKSGGTSIGPNILLPASLFGMVPFPQNDLGWLMTNAGEALVINLSAATAIGITVLYVLI